MTLARRVAVAVAALAGLAVAVLGLWLAVVLGPSGTASFTARATGPVVVGADILGALDVPVTVRAHRGDGEGVFLGEARSGEVADVIGQSRVLRVSQARFPARVMDLSPMGSGALADPSALDVWRETSRGTLDVTQAGSSAVLVAPTGGDPVTIVVTRRHPVWFLEAVAAVVVGVVVAGAAGWWLVRQLGHLVPLGRAGARRPRAASSSPSVTPAPVHGEDGFADLDPAAATASSAEPRP